MYKLATLIVLFLAIGLVCSLSVAQDLPVKGIGTPEGLGTTAPQSDLSSLAWPYGPPIAFPNSESNTLGLWHFGEGGSAVTTVNSASGPNSLGTVFNGVLEPFAQWTTNSLTGFGNAIYFTGSASTASASYVTLGPSTTKHGLGVSDEFTVEAYYYQDTTPPQDNNYVVSRQNSGDWQFNLMTNQSKQLYAWLRTTTGFVNPFSTGSAKWTPFTWNHVALAYQKGIGGAVFVNSKLVGIDQSDVNGIYPGAGNELAGSGTPIFVGAMRYAPATLNAPTHGIVDEVRLSKVNRYKSLMPYANSDDNTLILLHMNEGSGSTTANSATGSATLGSSFDGVLEPYAVWTSGQTGFGNAVYFTGSASTASASYITVGPSTTKHGLGVSDEITIEAWYYQDTTPPQDNNYVVSRQNSGDWQFNLMTNQSKQVYGWLRTTTGFVNPFSSGTAKWTPYTWNNIAMTYKEGFGGALFVNGELVGVDQSDVNGIYPGAGNEIAGSGTPIFVGAMRYAPATLIAPTHGIVDEVRISNNVRDRYSNVPFVATDNDTLILLHLNEGSGSTTANAASGLSSLGSTYDGILEPFAEWTTGNTGFGNAVYFTGSASTASPSYITVGPSNDTSGFGLSTALTIEAWYKQDTTPPQDNNYIVSRQNSQDWQLNFMTNQSQALYAWVRTTSGFVNPFSSARQWRANEWVHLAVTYEEGVGGRVYVNGVLVGSDGSATDGIYPGAGNNLAGSGTPLIVGAMRYAPATIIAPTHGTIDEVRISNVVRTTFPAAPPDLPTSINEWWLY
jgi:hypothetical protein